MTSVNRYTLWLDQTIHPVETRNQCYKYSVLYEIKSKPKPASHMFHPYIQSVSVWCHVYPSFALKQKVLETSGNKHTHTTKAKLLYVSLKNQFLSHLIVRFTYPMHIDIKQPTNKHTHPNPPHSFFFPIQSVSQVFQRASQPRETQTETTKFFHFI